MKDYVGIHVPVQSTHNCGALADWASRTWQTRPTHFWLLKYSYRAGSFSMLETRSNPGMLSSLKAKGALWVLCVMDT
jgi:hypothetical protein